MGNARALWILIVLAAACGNEAARGPVAPGDGDPNGPNGPGGGGDAGLLPDGAPAPPTALPDAGVVVLPLPTQSGDGTFTMPGRTETAIAVDLPSSMPANPPIVIAFHSTGGEPSEGISLATGVTDRGGIVIAPRAGYRNGGNPGDVDHEPNRTGASSWNLWELDITKNEDLRYVLSLIASAKAQYNADTTRVYTMGYSNGAFMSWFVAASLPTVIAGFAESSGGWTTDSCPTRYDADSNNLSYYPTSGPAPGVAIACSSMYAAANFPKSCIPSATNHLRPPTPGARVPFGYLAHYSSDDTVSVQWSCFLGDVLGSRAKVTIRWSDSDGTKGHNWPPDFVASAWTYFANRTNAQ